MDPERHFGKSVTYVVEVGVEVLMEDLGGFQRIYLSFVACVVSRILSEDGDRGRDYFDIRAAANRTGYEFPRFLRLEGGPVVEPSFESVVLFTFLGRR